MKSSIWLSSLVAVVVATASFAKESPKKEAVTADNKEAFTAVAETVRKEMDNGGRYEYLKPNERSQVEAKLSEMSALFDKDGTVAAMNEDSKIKLFSAQESVNSILALRDRDRVICKKQTPVGSHIPVATCQTYGQEQEALGQTRKDMEYRKRAQCGRGGGAAACGGG